MAFGNVPPTLSRIDARLALLRRRLAQAKRNVAKAKKAKTKSAWLKRQRRITAAIRALTTLRVRVQRQQARRSPAPVQVTSAEERVIDEGSEEVPEELEEAEEEEASDGSGDMGRPDSATLVNLIANVRANISAERRAIEQLDATVRNEIRWKKLFWATRRTEALRLRRIHQAKLDGYTKRLSRLLQQQREVAPPPHSTRTLTQVASRFVATERPAAAYSPKGPTVTPVSRDWLAVPDVQRRTPLTKATAPMLSRHYHNLLLKYQGKLAPEVRITFETRRLKALELLGVRSGTGMSRGSTTPDYSRGQGMQRTAIEPLKQAIAEHKVRFERARLQRNYAESTRINDALERLETQLRTVQMQTVSQADVPYPQSDPTFSPLAPMQYTSAKQGASAAEPSEVDTATEPVDPGAEGEGAGIETEETPWYMRPLVIVGAIAAAAVAVMVAKGKKGKKEHAQSGHAPTSHS